MRGELVPGALLPRFTTWAGTGTFATAPLDVTAFEKAHMVFGRGPLVGGAASNPFRVWFEESHDAVVWTEALSSLTQPVTQANQSDRLMLTLTKRWLRVRCELAGDASGIVGITTWLTGGFQRRVR